MTTVSNKVTVTITREAATSIQQTISEPIIEGNNVSVICYDGSDDKSVLEAVMYAIEDSELIDEIYEANHKDAIVNGLTYSLSLCEFR